MGKRGQVTIFIILGILILLLIVLALYLYQNQRTAPQVVEPEFLPIKNYVEECMNVVAGDALKLLGSQGGYIELPVDIALDAQSYLSLGNGIIKIPLWYYQARNRMPYLLKADGSPSIEQQLDDYVSAHLTTCLQNFSVFTKQFNIQPSKNIMTDISIGEDSVLVSVDYSLKIKDRTLNKIGTISKFQKEIPLQLKKMYTTAQNIMQAENNNMYLEKMTIDLMGMNPKIPFSGMTFDCGGKQWFLSDITKELQSMLYYAIPSIRIYNTDYPPFQAQPSVYEDLRKFTTEDFYNGRYPTTPTPEDAYDYFNYFWDVKIPPNKLKVGFLFVKDRNFKIDAQPSDNGILKSVVNKGANQFLSFMCLNMYHFTYDLEYPVQVLIRDDTAFMNTGYTFQFAFPVLINHNEGDREKIGALPYDTVIPYTGYCDNLGGSTYDIRATGTDENGFMGVDLNDANISYNCLKFRCSLGTTKPDSGVYRLQTQLPTSCAHGYITAEKDGYLKGESQVLDSTKIEVALQKLRKFNFTIVNNKYHGGIFDTNTAFTSNMEAYVTLQSYAEPSLLTYKKFPFDANATLDDKSISLIEENGNYKIDIYMIDDVDGIITGGYKCNWTVNYNDMQGKNEVVFHSLEYLPKPLENQQQYDMIKFLDDGTYCENAKPEFKVDSSP